jgi:patatin-related protein
VLDSEHYRDVLENGFRVMWENRTHPSEPECPSATPELDLFVTGTSFYGRYSQAVDSTGRVIETKQHRTVFLLKHRERKDSKCQLDPRRDAAGRGDPGASPDAGLLSLAKLAQITSCFPGAFAAVHVDARKVDDEEPGREPDQRLKVWGALPDGEHYFVDGGVLDNRPFTTTLDAIFHRPADRRVCRHVLYLEPDPERFSKEIASQRDADGRLSAPSFLSSVLDSMTRLPSYESIADDLARIAEHNTWVQRFNELVTGLQQNGGAPASEETYLATRLLAIAQRVNAELSDALASARAKLDSDATGKLLRDLTHAIQKVPKDEIPALLEKVDVDFYIRRLIALTYFLEGKAARDVWKLVNQELQWLEIVRSAMEQVVVPPHVGKDGRLVDAASHPVDAVALWTEIRRRTLMLLDSGEVHAPVSGYPRSDRPPAEQRESLRQKDLEREELRKKLKVRLKRIEETAASDLPAEEPERTLLEDSGARLKSLVRTSPAYVGEFLARFERREDPLRFPLEFAAGVHQRDLINVVRLSPFDAQNGLSRRALEDKICGETFGHFGAFLKRSWRSNDILWGRLDGISRLVETLLSHTPFGKGVAATARRRLVERLGATREERRAFLGRLFPRLDERLRTHSKSEHGDPLSALLDLLEAQVDPAPEVLLERLTETAQLDALCEDVPKVIADAAEEQLEWGQRKVTVRRLFGGEEAGEDRSDPRLVKAATKAEGKAKRARIRARKADGVAAAAEGAARRARAKVRAPAAEPDPAEPTARKVAFSARAWEFQATSGTLDTSVLNLATRLFAERSLAKMSVEDVEHYFRHRYAVGSESAFHTIPVTVLADLGARGAVLAEHALIGSSGRVGQTLRENGIYRLMLRWPLSLIAALAGFLRRSPEYRVSLVVGSLLYAALALVANVLLFGALYEQDGFRRTVAIWAFALLPITALIFAWVIWRSPAGKRVLVGALMVAAAFATWWKADEIVLAVRTTCVQSCRKLPKAAPLGREQPVGSERGRR